MGFAVSPASATQESAPRHWERRTIYVNDHTGPYWPVGRSSSSWNYGGSVRLIYGRSCRAGYPCIHVYSKWSSSAYIGTVYYAYSNGIIYSAKITMNRRFNSSSYWLRKGATVHELGHAIGLNHDTYKTSVMYYRVSRSSPSSYDYGVVRREYYGVRW